MDLKQIRYFLEVVDQGSINMAAHKLGMTQPPVSKQMQDVYKRQSQDIADLRNALDISNKKEKAQKSQQQKRVHRPKQAPVQCHHHRRHAKQHWQIGKNAKDHQQAQRQQRNKWKHSRQ